MPNKFCSNCGTQMQATAKFCGSCGQANEPTIASSAPATETYDFQTSAMVAAKKSTNKPVIIGAIAAFVVIAAAVVFFVIKPFSSMSLEGKSASQILDQLFEDDYCISTAGRSAFDIYPNLQDQYDRDQLRTCEDPAGDRIYIYGNMTKDEVEEEVGFSEGEDYTIVAGDSWVIEFDGGKYEVAGEAVSRYSGELRN